MKPGRELDALVAEKVMGWVLYQRQPDVYLAYTDPGGSLRLPEEIPFYSTDMAAAWLAEEKLVVDGFTFELYRDPPAPDRRAWFETLVIVRRGREYSYIGKSETGSAPHAICLAALRAKGVEL
jgi:hypothetical protein